MNGSGNPSISNFNVPIMSGMGAMQDNPYVTKVGGGSGGIQIPNIQYQSPKGQTGQQAPAAMPSVGSGLQQATPTITDNLKQAYNMYQQRFGQGNAAGTTLPMNSNAGGVWAGNPTQAQVGPATPTTPQVAATNPGVATSSPGIDAANASNTGYQSGGSDPGSSAGSSAVGGGIASALGSVSKAFGQESQTDAKMAANPPKPTVTGQPFANFAYTPMFGGGSIV